MNHDLKLVFEEHFLDLKFRELTTSLINELVKQAISHFLKKDMAKPELPAQFQELKGLLKQEAVADQELLDTLIDFYFEKVQARLERGVTM